MNTKSKSTSALFASVGLLAVFAAALASEEKTGHKTEDIPPVDAMAALAKLKAGKARYAKGEISPNRDTVKERAEKRAETSLKQHPFAVTPYIPGPPVGRVWNG